LNVCDKEIRNSKLHSHSHFLKKKLKGFQVKKDGQTEESGLKLKLELSVGHVIPPTQVQILSEALSLHRRKRFWIKMQFGCGVSTTMNQQSLCFGLFF